MQILKVIYFVARTWFDFNVLLPAWAILIQLDRYLSADGEKEEPVSVDYQGP